MIQKVLYYLLARFYLTTVSKVIQSGLHKCGELARNITSNSIFPSVFFTFLNYANDTKSRNVFQII